MDGIGLYFKYISYSVRSQMMYKASFIYMTMGNFLITVVEFVGIIALFQRFGTIQGWSLEEVALIYGVINCGFALAESIGRGYDLFSRLVVSGDFDRLLLRPRSLTVQILGSELQLMRIGRFLQGLVVLVWSMTALEIGVLSIEGLVIILTVISSMLVFMGLFILQATISFWSIQSLEVMNAFTYGGVQMGQYPISIYKKWFQRIFTFIIPLGSVVHYPIQSILGRGGLYSQSYMIGLFPLISLIFFGVAMMIFNTGVRHYKSTGS